MSGRAWVGVDLDGTLAKYSGWVSETHIGDPIPAMVERVKGWLENGHPYHGDVDVRIFTARASTLHSGPDGVPGEDRTYSQPDAIGAIEAWCLEHIGEVLPITCQKDYLMVELWDDRCVQVVPNDGRAIHDLPLETYITAYAEERGVHLLPVADEIVERMTEESEPIRMKLTKLPGRLLDCTLRVIEEATA